jgi:hypothetical protein
MKVQMWHLNQQICIVLKLNFSKEIPGDTEICHSISAAACVRRTLSTKIITSSLDSGFSIANFSAAAALFSCPVTIEIIALDP